MEIESNQLTSKVLVLPPDTIGKALKNGKLAFSWKEIKSWLPDTTAPESVQDSESLELPMSVVVPLFMAAQKPKLTGKKVEVDLSIPAVFDKPGSPTEVSTSIIEEKTPEDSAPASPDLPAVDSKDNFKAIIQKSLKMPGVAGSILTGKEGLILEGSLPDVFDKDGFAGILPQIFDRVNHYAGEIKLGSLEAMGLTLDKVPLQVWKIGNFYFAVLGKKGEPLPTEELISLVKKLATISN